MLMLLAGCSAPKSAADAVIGEGPGQGERGARSAGEAATQQVTSGRLAVEPGFPDLSGIRVPHLGPKVTGTYVDQAGVVVPGQLVRLAVLFSISDSILDRVAVDGLGAISEERPRVEFGFAPLASHEALSPTAVSPYDPEWPDFASVDYVTEFHTSSDERGRFGFELAEGTARLAESGRVRLVIIAGDARSHAWCDVAPNDDVQLRAVDHGTLSGRLDLPDTTARRVPVVHVASVRSDSGEAGTDRVVFRVGPGGGFSRTLPAGTWNLKIGIEDPGDFDGPTITWFEIADVVVPAGGRADDARLEAIDLGI